MFSTKSKSLCYTRIRENCCPTKKISRLIERFALVKASSGAWPSPSYCCDHYGGNSKSVRASTSTYTAGRRVVGCKYQPERFLTLLTSLTDGKKTLGPFLFVSV